MNEDLPAVDCATATAIVRQCLSTTLNVVASQRLQGGMCRAVFEWHTDGEPAALVAKLGADDDGGLQQEYQAQCWVWERHLAPVPQPYGYQRETPLPGSACLLMARAAGRNLAAARLRGPAAAHFQQQLAESVAALHHSHRATYGSVVGGAATARWLEWFAPRLEENFRDTRDRLSPAACAAVDALLVRLPQWLPETASPTLVHGDLWATNIMVDQDAAGQPVVSALLDGNWLYADVEYELAYLQVFHTADQAFFDRYASHHALRPGFEQRCRVYWLNTMLLHLWLFGDEYRPACERLAREVAAWQ